MSLLELPRSRGLFAAFLACSLLFASAGVVRAQQDTAEDPEPLRVLLVGSEPFVTGDEPPRGLAVELWKALSGRLELDFRLERAENAEAALARVAEGEADVAVGPISITPDRAERVAFTQPYLDAALGIAAPSGGSALDRLIPFLTVWFSGGAGVLFLTLAGVGALFWLAERRVNPEHFPRHPLKGIGSGIWMALVTMTTVGYGDRVPQTLAGRVVAGVWMLFSLLIASSMVAFLASAVTLSQIDEPRVSSAKDLRDRQVAVVKGTTSVKFVTRWGGQPVPAEDLAGAVAQVEAGRADAVVFDRPAIRYYLSQNPQVELRLSDGSYLPQGYGLALEKGSPLRQPLDVEVLRLRESGFVEQLTDRWLGP